jgi:V-type H+-transporting ATPase subunit C
MSEGGLILIGLKKSESKQALAAKTAALATCKGFNVPDGLRVGTLDSLMALSDDLAKMDTVSEATAFKIYTKLLELKGEAPTIRSIDVASYVMGGHWEWDETKFQINTPLRELCETVAGRIGGLDDELKAKTTELNTLKGAIDGAKRKTQGNLQVKALTEVVNPANDLVNSEELVTLLVCVPKTNTKEFEEGYSNFSATYKHASGDEKTYKYVMPNSAKLLETDAEYALYRVVLLRKFEDDFKATAREKRLNVREYTAEPGAKEADAKKMMDDEAEAARQEGLLTNWCSINFTECYGMLMHLKAVRVFVESVLRYGLTAATYGGGGTQPNFTAYVLQPKRGKKEALRKALHTLYGGGEKDEGMDEEEAVVPGAGIGEFFPYVSVALETAPISAQ